MFILYRLTQVNNKIGGLFISMHKYIANIITVAIANYTKGVESRLTDLCYKYLYIHALT